MKKALLTILFVFLLPSVMAEEPTEEDRAREKLFDEYGGRDEYEKRQVEAKSAKGMKNLDRSKYQIKVAKKGLLKPMIEDQAIFDSLEPDAQKRYLDQRRADRAKLISFIRRTVKRLDRYMSAQEIFRLKTNTAFGLASEDIDRLGYRAGSPDMPIPYELSEDGSDGATLKGGKASDGTMVSGKKIQSAIPKGINQNFLLGMMPAHIKGMLGKMMKENPLSFMKRGEIKDIIVQRTEGKPLGSFLKNNPKILNTIIDICHDKKAIPSFISIINQPLKTKLYGALFLVLIIVIFILNLKNSNKSLFKRILFKLFLTGMSLSINLILFIGIFYDELKPTFDILKKNLL